MCQWASIHIYLFFFHWLFDVVDVVVDLFWLLFSFYLWWNVRNKSSAPTWVDSGPFSLPHPHFFLKGEVKGWDTCSDGDSGETWKTHIQGTSSFFKQKQFFFLHLWCSSPCSLPELCSLLCIFGQLFRALILPTVSVPLCLCLSCLTYAPRVLFFSSFFFPEA